MKVCNFKEKWLVQLVRNTIIMHMGQMVCSHPLVYCVKQVQQQIFCRRLHDRSMFQVLDSSTHSAQY